MQALELAIYRLTPASIPDVAHMMHRIKPEFWDAVGAAAQLSSGQGWYLASDEGEPFGWLLYRCYEVYKTVEIETLGYNDQGQLSIGPGLEPLLDKCGSWAAAHGMKNIRFIIASRDLSCHNRTLGPIWQELRDLCAVDRPEFDWLTRLGFLPSGILPDIYGAGYHGILLIKSL